MPGNPSVPSPAPASPGGSADARFALAAAVFLLFFGYTVFQSAPHLTGGDCGEYVTAAAYLGNTHPPGNPVHHMLAHAALHFPFGDAYFRSAAVSCLAAAGAVCVLCELLAVAGCGPVAAAGTALLFGVSPLVMRNALVTEVYTLLLLFGALASAYYLRAVRDGAPRTARAFRALAFAAGLGMGVHYLSAFFVLPLLAAAWRGEERKARSAAIAGLLFLCGFAVMLYLPARSLAHPPADYGSPSTLRSFLHAVTWREYASRPAEGRSAALLVSQVLWAGEALVRSVSPAVLPLAAAGAAVARTRLSGALPLLAGGTAVFAANVVLQNFPSRIMTLSEMPRFLALAAFPLYALAGLGVDGILRLARSLRARGARRAVPAIAAGAFLLLAAVSGWRSANLYDRSGDFTVRDHLREVFLSLPPNAAVFVEGDTANFSALATHFVERLRTDLLPIDRTGSYLASIYSFDSGAPPGRPDPLSLERMRAEKESAFIGSYPFPAAYVSLPRWAERAGGWKRYGRIVLFERGAGTGAYRFPPAGPVRHARNAATACDLKTRIYAASVLLNDFLGSGTPSGDGGVRIEQIADIGWDNPLSFVAIGTIRMNSGRLGEAERDLRHALAIYPPSVEAKEQLGILLARTNRPDEAATLLSDPELGDSPEAQFHLGNHSNRQGNFREAIARYEHALSLGYRNPAILSNLGVAYAREGKRDRARALFLDALRLDPGYPGAKVNLKRMDDQGFRRPAAR